jgi:hypothetical protein
MYKLQSIALVAAALCLLSGCSSTAVTSSSGSIAPSAAPTTKTSPAGKPSCATLPFAPSMSAVVGASAPPAIDDALLSENDPTYPADFVVGCDIDGPKDASGKVVWSLEVSFSKGDNPCKSHMLGTPDPVLTDWDYATANHGGEGYYSCGAEPNTSLEILYFSTVDRVGPSRASLRALAKQVAPSQSELKALAVASVAEARLPTGTWGSSKIYLPVKNGGYGSDFRAKACESLGIDDELRTILFTPVMDEDLGDDPFTVCAYNEANVLKGAERLELRPVFGNSSMIDPSVWMDDKALCNGGPSQQVGADSCAEFAEANHRLTFAAKDSDGEPVLLVLTNVPTTDETRDLAALKRITTKIFALGVKEQSKFEPPD